MKYFLSILILATLLNWEASAQSELEVDLDLRSRLQFRNGYRQLRKEGDKPFSLIFQRNRIGASYTYKNLVKTYISFQDVRIWGQEGQFDDTPNTNLFQAWGELNLSPRWKLKVGRQELLFDDGYLFGSRPWREGGFAHDAAKISYRDSTFEVQAVLALNQSQASNVPTTFNSDNYKNLQVLWMKKHFNESYLSLIFANRALRRNSDSANIYTQTFGPSLKLKKGKVEFNAYYFYQLGKDLQDKDARSYSWSGKISYQALEAWKILFGVDVLSGTNAQDLANANYSQNNSFDNLYAYRHRYFGHMDYFYVGFNPATGLQDFMLKNTFNINKKLKANLDLHSFYSHADLIDPENVNMSPSKYLGLELNTILTYKIHDWVVARGGYAQLWGSPSLEIVNVRSSNGDRNKLTNWFWLELRFTPKILKLKFDK